MSVPPSPTNAGSASLVPRMYPWVIGVYASFVLEGVCEPLSPLFRPGRSAEPLQHQSDHSDLNHGLAVLDDFLVVFAESPTVAQPSERAFDQPPLGQHLKADLAFQLAHDFQNPTAPLLQPFDELSGVAAVGPDQRDRRKRSGCLQEHQLGSVAILNRRRMDHDRQQQA